MSKIDENLIPLDQQWLRGLYPDPSDAVVAFEYVRSKITKRFAKQEDDEGGTGGCGLDGHFKITLVDVVFEEDRSRYPRPITEMAWGSSTLVVHYPHPRGRQLTLEEMDGIRFHYQERFTPRLKEAEMRIKSLFWYMTDKEEQRLVLESAPPTTQLKDLELFEKGPEIDRNRSRIKKKKKSKTK